MPRNGRERESNDELRREASLRRAAIKRTAAALEDRLRERTGQIAEAFDRTRDQLEGLDDLIHRHRYLFIGGAVGIGLAMARRSSARGAAVGPQNGVRYIMVERPRPGLLRSLAGGLAALALRQGAHWLAAKLTESDDDDEPLLLPPATPPR